MAPFPFPQLSELREKYIYNIRPLTSSFALVKKGLQLFQSDDEEEADQADDQIMLANWYATNAFNSNKAKDHNNSRTPSPHSENVRISNTLANSMGSTPVVTTGATNTSSNNFLSSTNIDPQRMTLDISLLKKQYAKLKERQRQAQVIITEGFQRANSSAFAKKDPITMNHLLMGKTALISKRPKRTSPVIQSATRANYDPKKMLRNRSNTVANLFANKTAVNNNKNNESKPNSRKNSDKIEINSNEKTIIETLSWTQIKLEKKRQKFQRKLSEPVLASFQESSLEESLSSLPTCAVDDNSVQLNNDRNASNETLDKSGSSSSTELCDDHLNDNLSDLASSPEVHRKNRLTPNEHQLSTEENNNYNKRESSVCEASNDCNQINEQPLSADQCLTTNNNSYCECDSSLDYEHRSEPIPTPTTDNCIKTEDTERDNSCDAYSTIKREISELSLEECIQKLNEKLISLNDENIKH